MKKRRENEMWEEEAERFGGVSRRCAPTKYVRKMRMWTES